MKKLAKILVLLFVLTIAVTCLVACGCEHTVDEYGYCTECDAKLLSENATFGLKYAIDRDSEANRYAYVTGYVGDNTDITISNIYDGLPVKKIQFTYSGNSDSNIPDSFNNRDKITTITIPDSVTSIGDSAFRDCTSLTSITIPDSVTSIGSYAFRDCDSLISITIPDSVTSIGSYAFAGCTSLTSITTPDSVTSIGDSAFAVCTSLISITIPDSVTSIGDYAFSYCYSLTSITIPDSVTSIGSYAFCDCDSLTSITIPNSVTSIGDDAFRSCDSLIIYCEETSKPSGWESDWNVSSCPVVWNCNNNEIAEDGCIYAIIDGIRYSLKDSVATVYRQPSNITAANIPTSVTYKGTTYAVTSIGSYAFRSCDSLTSITIPDSVTSIGDSAFHRCTSLENVIFGENSQLDSIGSYAFYNCTSLKSITIPDSVTSIDSYAFYNCTSLSTITIPDSVTIIAECTFYNCTSLKSITIPDSVMSIGSYAFSGCTSLSIYCEATSKPSGWSSSWNYSNRPVCWYSETEPTTEGNYWHYVNGVVTVW